MRGRSADLPRRGGSGTSWRMRSLSPVLRLGSRIVAALAVVGLGVGLVTSEAKAAAALRDPASPPTSTPLPSPQTPPPRHEPVLIRADVLFSNQRTSILTAIGHVEITQGARLVRADRAAYDKIHDRLHAEGHVVAMEPAGEVLFGDSAELTSDLSQGFVDKAGVLFPDTSRFAAQDARRYAKRWIVADRGVYSACNLCKDNPEAPPLWSIKGVRVTHDSEKKNVMYRDATVNFWDFPVLYLPYFAHPDPTVRRRQGLLIPSIGTNTYTGPFVRTPYYWDLAPNSDLITTPTFSQNDKVQLDALWRYRLTNGQMAWHGSFVNADFVSEYGVDKGQRWRGHLFGKTLFDLTPVWRFTSDTAWVSDKSYLPRYRISIPDTNTLISRGTLEGFEGRNYAAANLYAFQDLRPGLHQVSPWVTPDMQFQALGEPGQTLGGRWSIGGGLLAITRDRVTDITRQGADVRRLSLNTDWQREWINATGLVTTLTGLARVDNYWATNTFTSSADGTTSTPTGTALASRPFTQGSLLARYPLARRGDGYQQIFEPIGVVDIAPTVNTHPTIPNEDSLDVEFDETNLFSSNRFTGYDRVEGGTRVAYGARNALVGDNGARLESIVGQVYRLGSEDPLLAAAGIRTPWSDYVGRVELSPADWLIADYSFRLSSSTGSLERQTLHASAGVPVFRPSLTYLEAPPTAVTLAGTTGTTQGVKAVTVGVSSAFRTFWTFSAYHQQALSLNPGPRSSSIGVSYKDECLEGGIQVSKDYTNRLDLQTGTSVILTLYLKNIGGLKTGGTLGGLTGTSTP